MLELTVVFTTSGENLQPVRGIHIKRVWFHCFILSTRCCLLTPQLLQRPGDWRGGRRQVPSAGEEQSEEGGRHTEDPHTVGLRGEAGRPLRVKPQLSPGHRVPGGGRPRHQVISLCQTKEILVK